MFQRKKDEEAQTELHPCARAYLQERLAATVCKSSDENQITEECRYETFRFLQLDKECEESNKQAGLPKLVFR